MDLNSVSFSIGLKNLDFQLCSFIITLSLTKLEIWLLDFVIISGSPRYCAYITFFMLQKILQIPFYTASVIFLLKKTADLFRFTSWPIALSYFWKIRQFYCSSLALQKIRESSVKNRWDSIWPLLLILRPNMLFLLATCLSKLLNSSA